MKFKLSVPYDLLLALWIVFSSGSLLFKLTPFNQLGLLVAALVSIKLYFSLNTICSQKEAARLLMPLIGMCAYVFLLMVVNWDFDSILSYAGLIIVMAHGYMISIASDMRKLEEGIVKVVVTLASISLISFYIELPYALPGLFSSIIFNEQTYYASIAYVQQQVTPERNYSIFLEPGIFQIYLNFALILIMFRMKFGFKSCLMIVVLIWSIYTTRSTAGYILTALIFVFWTLSLSRSRGPAAISISLILTILAIFAIISYTDLADNIDSKLFGDGELSYIVRLHSTIVDLQAIAENPLFGLGVGNYQNYIDASFGQGLTANAATNTYTQIGAIYGLPVILVFIGYLGLSIYRDSDGVMQYLVWIVFAVISFSTQPFVLYSFFYFLVFRRISYWSYLRLK